MPRFDSPAAGPQEASGPKNGEASPAVTNPVPPVGRRCVLRLMSALPLSAAGPMASFNPNSRFAAADPPPIPTAPFPNGATLLVAGPDSGRLAEWGRLIAPGLSRPLPPGTGVRLTTAGGADGVTGANQFDTRAAPDGRTLLFAPGEAVLAWLVGDPRAKFDVGDWVSVLAGVTPSVVVGRIAAQTLQAGHPTRVAATGIEGPDLAVLLGVELLGARAVPAFGVTQASLPAAIGHGSVDVALVRGERVPARVAALAAAGARPLFSIGAADQTGAPARDAAFPGLPSIEELYTSLHGRRPAGPLYRGWRAAAVASRLTFGLILADLTPAAMVALWRRAGIDAATGLDFGLAAAAATLQPLPGPAANSGTAPIAADMAALLALRQWLNSRFNWHPV